MDLAVTGWPGPQVVGTDKGQPLCCSSGLAISLHVSYLPEKFLWGQHLCVLLSTGQGLGTCWGPTCLKQLEWCSPGAAQHDQSQFHYVGGKKNTWDT